MTNRRRSDGSTNHRLTQQVSPVHRPRLVSTVGDVVEDVAHARILCALLRCAEVIIHHLVQDVVRDSTSTIRDPSKTNMTVQEAEKIFTYDTIDNCSPPPDDKVNVVVGDGDDHVGHVVGGIQVALHGGSVGMDGRDVECVEPSIDSKTSSASTSWSSSGAPAGCSPGAVG